MVVGEPEPLVEGHGAVAVLIDGGELVLAASGPELAAELLGEGSGGVDHALELALVHLAIKVLVSGDESPKCLQFTLILQRNYTWDKLRFE